MAQDPILSLMTFGQICRFIGGQVRKRREYLDLSRKELAKKSGVSEPTIARLELKGVATIGVVVKLAMALDSVETLTAIFASPKYKSIDEFVRSEE